MAKKQGTDDALKQLYSGHNYFSLRGLALCYITKRNKIILPKDAQRKVKQKLVKYTIDKLPATFPYIFKAFVEGKRPPDRQHGSRIWRGGIREQG